MAPKNRVTPEEALAYHHGAATPGKYDDRRLNPHGHAA